jgi:hypothetical protein
MRVKERETGRREFRPLRKHEIDRRIEVLIADLAARPGDSETDAADDELRPRAITARELVRRMRPFIVLN